MAWCQGVVLVLGPLREERPCGCAWACGEMPAKGGLPLEGARQPWGWRWLTHGVRKEGMHRSRCGGAVAAAWLRLGGDESHGEEVR